MKQPKNTHLYCLCTCTSANVYIPCLCV